MRARRAMVLVLALPAVGQLGACVGGGDDPLSVDQLADAGRTCPVDLDGAVADAGLGDPTGEVQVEVETGSGEGGRDAAALDQVGGVYVECTLPAGEGRDVTSYVFASELPGAVSVLLPLIQQDLGLSMDDLEAVLDRFSDTSEGELVDLGSLDADGPGAVARIAVDGADSAVLYVSASDGAASPGQVRTITERLVGEL